MSALHSGGRNGIGLLAGAALLLLAAAGAFQVLAVAPLERRALALEQELKGTAHAAPRAGLTRVGGASPEVKLEAFYRYFQREESPAEWLALLHTVASASGLELRVGEYRAEEPGRRLQRYRIALPVSGTYTQVRAFIEASLEAVPVLSLDQASFRRRTVNDGRVEVDLSFTLYLPGK